ncbi:FAD-binding oxidoreductase [Asticcacaulis sp. AND118]|uniref:NAD(P)/FAD-dependent oxidoreductase n=1 Tax=Asticcacaulis sp. AND118 TaxID=2840468 RepID=UPI0027149C7B|nr:FAD-binding oxidoreductase [Asticcacaulis sp. AND118]
MSVKLEAITHGLWAATAPEAPVTAVLYGDVRADVAVVGAGYTGLSAALTLAEAGARVVVIEAREIGFGGAGRNVGLVNAGMWVMPDELPRVLGAVHGERLLTALGDGPKEVFARVDKHNIACELKREGTLHCAVGAAGVKELSERAQQWQARGADVRLLDAAETRRMVGTDAYAAALLDKRAGTIQPLAYVRGLATAAVAAGVDIRSESPVEQIEAAGDQWCVTTSGGTVTAPRVIMATDAYTKGPWEIIRKEQVYLPYFNCATTPLPPDILRHILPEGHGAWDTAEVLSSFRMDAAGRLVFGSVGALRGAAQGVHSRWGRRAMAKLFPALKGVGFEHEWYGWIGMTDDNLPRFHRFADGVVGVSGYNGRGIAPGTVMGRVLAEHVLGKLSEDELPLPVTTPQEARHRAVKEVYYEAGAAMLHAVEHRF